MTLKLFVRLLLVVAFAATSLTSLSVCAGERRPNIIFFLVDDLGWRDLGCYGSPFYETPHIDQFAQESVRFTQAYAACHVCSPTRASILTGKYPARLALTDWLPGRKDFPFQKLQNAEIHQQLALEEVTIAESLKANGYRTAHIGKWHLGEGPFGPLQQGFDIQVPHWNKGWPKAGYHAPLKMDNLTNRDGDYLTDRLTDEAERFIESSKDEPFFLYLAHFAVHDPIQGRNDLVAKYQRKLEEMNRTDTELNKSDSTPFVLEGNPDDPQPLSRKELDLRVTLPAWSEYKVLAERTVKIKQQQDNIQFAAMVESVDESLRRLRSKLKALNLENDTIIILFSDNGGMSAANFGNPERFVNANSLDTAYSTSNLPLRGAKGWLYEGGIRVPLIVNWPQKGQRGRVCETPVISTDMYPTILDMAGIDLAPQQHIDGVSLAPLVSGPAEIDCDAIECDVNRREAIFWHFPHYSNHGMQSPGGAIRVGDYKLLEYFENETVQLFNLRTDISEQNDVSEAEPDKTAELRGKLHAWRQAVSAKMMPVNPDYVDGLPERN